MSQSNTYSAFPNPTYDCTMDELEFLKIKSEVLKIAEQVDKSSSDTVCLDLLYSKLEILKQLILAELAKECK